MTHTRRWAVIADKVQACEGLGQWGYAADSDVPKAPLSPVVFEEACKTNPKSPSFGTGTDRDETTG
ncbi:hypothetical protein [Haloferax sp. DFSO52]|uniref:hypothetical protein n=1 Tax=Haloferax sp. DFSO52 TaxID=3388505 RepID=UPI003A864672